jgi:glycosyltransferase involved in cell wall biosynthesis
MPETQKSAASPMVSIIVPARNEEACLGTCLESLVAQTGVNFEIIAVDDHSTDRTREIAASFPSVSVIEAGSLPDGWTGKNNAVATGVRSARGEWLLFTDADTVHLPGSLARALKEAQENNADLLSYSPEQIAVTFWEMAVLPVVFAELARQYPPSKVSDPNSLAAAANGQYILAKREAYDAVGGHASIADSILEDVALAHAMKASGRRIRFRYAADAVCTRMYRNLRQLRDGWTKNLAFLFPYPRLLAAKILTGWVFFILGFFAAVPLIGTGGMLWRRHEYFFIANFIASVIADFAFWIIRIRKAKFSIGKNILGVLFGMPMFAYLLLRSKNAYIKGTIFWKGRVYSDGRGKPNTIDTREPAAEGPR